MRFVRLLLKIVIFVLVLGFALKNSQVVTVEYFLGYQWQAPLVLVMLITFFLGILAGALAVVPYVLRGRRQLALQRKQEAPETVIEPS